MINANETQQASAEKGMTPEQVESHVKRLTTFATRINYLNSILEKTSLLSPKTKRSVYMILGAEYSRSNGRAYHIAAGECYLKAGDQEKAIAILKNYPDSFFLEVVRLINSDKEKLRKLAEEYDARHYFKYAGKLWDMLENPRGAGESYLREARHHAGNWNISYEEWDLIARRFEQAGDLDKALKYYELANNGVKISTVEKKIAKRPSRETTRGLLSRLFSRS